MQGKTEKTDYHISGILYQQQAADKIPVSLTKKLKYINVGITEFHVVLKQQYLKVLKQKLIPSKLKSLTDQEWDIIKRQKSYIIIPWFSYRKIFTYVKFNVEGKAKNEMQTTDKYADSK